MSDADQPASTGVRGVGLVAVAALLSGLLSGVIGYVLGLDDSASTDPVAQEALATPEATSTTVETGGHSGHGDIEDMERDPDRPTMIEFSGPAREELAQQLLVAREVALLYPTRADAEAAGFEPTTPFTPGLGSHMGKDEATHAPGAAFDPRMPQSYLYDGTEPGSKLVGLMYVQLGGDTPPEGFAGPLDPWHAVIGQCLKADEFDPLFPAADAVPQDRCEEAGGRFIDVTAWTQHAWVVPGWEAPGGVFAAFNTDIICADGTTDSDPVDGCTSPMAK